MGEPMSGKSTLAEKLTADAHRVLYFDLCGDYDKPGRLVVTIDELEKWPELLDDRHSRVVVAVQGDDEKSIAAEALRTLQACELAGADFDRARKAGPGVSVRSKSAGRVVVFDEVGDYRRYAESTLNRLFRRGRHYGLVPILASQVATDFPLTCRRLASHVSCLAQSHDGELEALEQIYGADFATRVRAWRHFQPPVLWTRKMPGAESAEEKS